MASGTGGGGRGARGRGGRALHRRGPARAGTAREAPARSPGRPREPRERSPGRPGSAARGAGPRRSRASRGGGGQSDGSRGRAARAGPPGGPGGGERGSSGHLGFPRGASRRAGPPRRGPSRPRDRDPGLVEDDLALVPHDGDELKATRKGSEALAMSSSCPPSWAPGDRMTAHEVSRGRRPKPAPPGPGAEAPPRAGGPFTFASGERCPRSRGRRSAPVRRHPDAVAALLFRGVERPVGGEHERSG